MIPFELAGDAREVREVHLHLSVDRGQNWQLYQRQAPSTKNFPFRASTDGEYWFAVRTIGRQQDQVNKLNLRPELIVVVDTQSPQLNLRLQNGNNGLTQADWYVQDDHLSVESFRLEFQDQNGDWKPIPFEKARTSSANASTQWKSQTAWRPQLRGKELFVRAQVWDRAGNSQVVQKRLAVDRTASSAWERAAQDQVASQEPSTIGQKWEDLASEIQGNSTSPWNPTSNELTTNEPFRSFADGLANSSTDQVGGQDGFSNRHLEQRDGASPFDAEPPAGNSPLGQRRAPHVESMRSGIGNAASSSSRQSAEWSRFGQSERRETGFEVGFNPPSRQEVYSSSRPSAKPERNSWQYSGAARTGRGGELGPRQ